MAPKFNETSLETIVKALINFTPNYPKPGVNFADVTELLSNKDAFEMVIDNLGKKFENKFNMVAGLESRGFTLAGAVANNYKVGVVNIRKQGKLPPPVISERYELEYGTNTLELPYELSLKGNKILLIDDVLATGGTADAGKKLLERAGAEVVGLSVIIEVAELNGRSALKPYQVESILEI